MNSAASDLIDAIVDVAGWMQARGIVLPNDLTQTIANLKTEAHYDRVLRRAVRDLYTSKIDESEFIDIQIRLVEEQFGRAWREGARDVDFNPENMTDDDMTVLAERVETEKDRILDYAQSVLDAREAGNPVDPLVVRADMWAARYPEVRDAARAHFGGRMHLRWQYGPTEHCDDCLRLNGTVAEAREWEQARQRGIYPRSAELACHGFNCACELIPTDDELTGEIPL